MRMQCDMLKYARLLRKKGVKSDVADGIMSTLTQVEIFNIYSKQEVDGMLSNAVKEVFAEHDRAIKDVFAKQDQKLAEQRREFDARMQDNAKYREQQLRDHRREFEARMKDSAKYHDQSLRDNKSELLASRRWMIGTMITIGLSMTAYFSTLLHFSH